ncbi:hypothetical protein [Nonomuraea typhae]|uniref:hypothetical protein n=1 Tax=Nonomuraea typhae TaxID=2603600 RepID=UPI0012FBC199|nr:hypothetical protein [Nonomuraea typhae]
MSAKNSVTLCDLRVFVNQPTETVTSDHFVLLTEGHDHRLLRRLVDAVPTPPKVATRQGAWELRDLI